MDDVIERIRNIESELGGKVRDILSQIEAAFNNPKSTGPFQIPSELLTQVLDEAVLNKSSSRFRGYVLSGFPSTADDAAKFFLEDAPVPEAVEGEEPRPPSDGIAAKILRPAVAPDIVVVLSSSEENCQRRSQECEPPVPEKEFANKMNSWKTAFPEEGARLTDIFSERGIEPLVLEIDDVPEDDLCDQVITHLTNARPVYNFRAVQAKQGADSKEQIADAQATPDEVNSQKEAEGRRKKKEEEDRLETIKKEEFARLERHSETLRAYLMQFVVPTLTTGLIDVCRETPEDPIAYLAEYLSSYSTEMINVRRRKRQAAMAPPEEKK